MDHITALIRGYAGRQTGRQAIRQAGEWIVSVSKQCILLRVSVNELLGRSGVGMEVKIFCSILFQTSSWKSPK